MRQNKAGDWQSLRQFCILMDHIQSLSTLCVIHIDGAHSLPVWTFPNITVKTHDRSYDDDDDHHHQHHSQYFRRRHQNSGKRLHPFKGMKLNASSLILLCQISDRNERKNVDTSSGVSKEPRRRPHVACLWFRVATRIELHVWTHIKNNQTYITFWHMKIHIIITNSATTSQKHSASPVRRPLG